MAQYVQQMYVCLLYMSIYHLLGSSFLTSVFNVSISACSLLRHSTMLVFTDRSSNFLKKLSMCSFSSPVSTLPLKYSTINQSFFLSSCTMYLSFSSRLRSVLFKLWISLSLTCSSILNVVQTFFTSVILFNFSISTSFFRDSTTPRSSRLTSSSRWIYSSFNDKLFLYRAFSYSFVFRIELSAQFLSLLKEWMTSADYLLVSFSLQVSLFLKLLFYSDIRSRDFQSSITMEVFSVIFTLSTEYISC